jgi:hypothetical protein
MVPVSVTIGHEFVQQRYICRPRAKIADITRFMGLIVASTGMQFVLTGLKRSSLSEL